MYYNARSYYKLSWLLEPKEHDTMQDMTPEEYISFLLDTARTAKLATVRKDGRPNVVPIWFDLDDDVFIFTTWHGSVKASNIRRDSRLSLCVDEEKPPFALVLAEGTAEITDEAEDLIYWATRVGERYMGPERAEEYGRRNAVPGELLVSITPTKVIAKKNVSD
jgi:PPOX class probable F420-dependent enzyme